MCSVNSHSNWWCFPALATKMYWHELKFIERQYFTWYAAVYNHILISVYNAGKSQSHSLKWGHTRIYAHTRISSMRLYSLSCLPSKAKHLLSISEKNSCETERHQTVKVCKNKPCNEGVSPAHCSVQLSADTKIHCGSERQRGIVRSETNLSNTLLLNVKHWVHSDRLLCTVGKERCGQGHSCLISAGINRGQPRTNPIIWRPGFVRNPVPFPPCQEAMKRNHSSSY